MAACGSSPPRTDRAAPPPQKKESALPALFAHVPAGTPYLVAGIDPLDREDLALASDLFGPAITDALPKHPAARPLVDALRAELGGDWTPERWEALGFTAAPRFAVYGLGLYPVARIEIKSADKVVATLGRITARLGHAWPAPQTRAGHKYWRFDDKSSAVIAVGDGELVVAVAPLADMDRELDEVLGAKPPAQSLDGKRLLALLDRHKLGRHFVALAETHPLIEQVIAQAGTPPSRECRDRLDALAAQMPRFIIGHSRSPARQMTFAAILELAGDLLADARALRVQVPGIAKALAGQPILAMAAALNLPAAATFGHAIASQLSELAGACSAPDLRTAADQLEARLGGLTAGLTSTITGFALSVHALEPGTTSKIPSRLDAIAVLTSTDAQALYTALMTLQPALSAFGLVSDGTMHELNLAMLNLSYPVYAGVSDHAFVVASGAAELAGASTVLTDTAARPMPLLAMTYDYTKFTELENAFGMLTDSQATVAARTKWFGRGSFAFDVDAGGLVMWSKIDLK